MTGTPVYDLWFVRHDLEWTTWFAAASDPVVWFAGDRKNGYDFAIGITSIKVKGEPRVIHVPSLAVDGTYAGGVPLERVEEADVPDDIRRRMAKAIARRHHDRRTTP